MVDYISFLNTGFGAFLIGLVVGFIAQKYFKLLAAVIGFQIAFITYLEYLNLISIEWEFIKNISDALLYAVQNLKIPDEIGSSDILFSSSTIGGFILGLYVGFFYG